MMPSALCNAPASFQCIVNYVVKDLLHYYIAACPGNIFDILHNLRGICRPCLGGLEFPMAAQNSMPNWRNNPLTSRGWSSWGPNILHMDPKEVEAITLWCAGCAKDLRICQHLLTIHEGVFFWYGGSYRSIHLKWACFWWMPVARVAFEKMKWAFTTGTNLLYPDPSWP